MAKHLRSVVRRTRGRCEPDRRTGERRRARGLWCLSVCLFVLTRCGSVEEGVSSTSGQRPLAQVPGTVLSVEIRGDWCRRKDGTGVRCDQLSFSDAARFQAGISIVTGVDWHPVAADASVAARKTWQNLPVYKSRVGIGAAGAFIFQTLVAKDAKRDPASDDYPWLRLGRLDRVIASAEAWTGTHNSAEANLITPLPAPSESAVGLKFINSPVGLRYVRGNQVITDYVDVARGLPQSPTKWAAGIIEIARYYNRGGARKKHSRHAACNATPPWKIWYCVPTLFWFEFGHAPFQSGWVKDASIPKWLATYDALFDGLRKEFPHPGNTVFLRAPSIVLDDAFAHNTDVGQLTASRLRVFLRHAVKHERVPDAVAVELSVSSASGASAAISRLRALLAEVGATTFAGGKLPVHVVDARLGDDVVLTTPPGNSSNYLNANSRRAAFLAAARIGLGRSVSLFGDGTVSRSLGAEGAAQPAALRWFSGDPAISGKYKRAVFPAFIFAPGILSVTYAADFAERCAGAKSKEWFCADAATKAALERRKFVLATPAPKVSDASRPSGSMVGNSEVSVLAITERCIGDDGKAQHCFATTDGVHKIGGTDYKIASVATRLIRVVIAAESADARGQAPGTISLRLSALGVSTQRIWARHASTAQIPVAWTKFSITKPLKQPVSAGKVTLSFPYAPPSVHYLEIAY